MKTAKQIRGEAKRLFRLCLVNGSLDEDRVRQVTKRVAEGRRRGHMALLSHFQRLVQLALSRRTAKVESAVPLPDGLRASVQAGLERVYGPGLNVQFIDRPDLIGGMRIKVGSDVYDGSVQAKLAALASKF
jgi:F-type H+-transporting ATPase subunit delta